MARNIENPKLDSTQLEQDKQTVADALPTDDTFTWEAWDRLCILLETFSDDA